MKRQATVIHFEGFQSRHSGRWVGECLEVAVSAQADSAQQLRDNLHEALTLYFEDVDELQAEGKVVSPIGRVPHYHLRLLRWKILFALAKRAANNRGAAGSYWSEPAARAGYA